MSPFPQNTGQENKYSREVHHFFLLLKALFLQEEEDWKFGTANRNRVNLCQHYSLVKENFHLKD